MDEEAGQEGAQLLGVGTNPRVRLRVRNDPDEVKAARRLLSGAPAAPIRRDFADYLVAVLKREAGRRADLEVRRTGNIESGVCAGLLTGNAYGN